MQLNHFYYVGVNDLYYWFFVEIGKMHLWACIGKNSFNTECLLKIDTEIYLCFKYREMLLSQQWLES